ncbi:hypothetical protein TRFO_27115 [Tritrichomonas foetus]|uniref:Uncharacterized protein n=1 Tax=Tritrichomonas foetus TaxID=1144522 RepID=A0A1J4K337_9EUKA|nr:hypothetical protein TRFO_27115 [Tritrichomonas foetus]|eukprot:OHT05240.1 hypothetical protein TRFO_27115 [Tritrichomonas foetus]
MEVRQPPSPRSSPRHLKSSRTGRRHCNAVKSPRYVFNQLEENTTNEIVVAVTNGLPIEQVNPKLYSTVQPYLENKLNQLVRDKNGRCANLVRIAISDMADYYNKQAIFLAQEEAKRNAREITLEEYEEQIAAQEEARKDSLNFTPEEIETSVSLALEERFDEIDQRIVPKLASELRRLQRESIKSGNYVDAGRYHVAARQVGTLSTDIRYEELTSSQAYELENRAINAGSDLRQLKLAWRKKLEKAKKQRDDDIEKLKAEQENRLIQFDEQFEAETPIQYKKYTSKVSELKKKEEYLVSSKRFKEATEMRKEVELQKQKEEAEFRSKYLADLEMKRADFIKKIKAQIDARIERANEEIFLLERERNRQIEQQMKTVKRFEEKSDALNNTLSLTSTNSSCKPNSSRANTRRNNCGSSGTMSRRRCDTARSVRGGFPTNSERSSEEIFRQRRAINAVLYTRTQSARLPRIEKK